MIFIGRFKEFCPNSDYPSIKNYFQSELYEGQDKIIQYLRNGKKTIVTAQVPHDVLTGKQIPMEKVGMNDGLYTWWSTLAYYVEKYNLRLPEEFEKHILGQ